MGVNIITVDDHEIFRKGLNHILNQIPNVKVIGEAGNGADFLALLEHALPDIVFTDVRMPVMNGIEACEKALTKYPALKIVAISMFGEEVYLEQMIRAGAQGFLLKNIAKDELKIVIEQIQQGKQYFSPELLPYFTNKFLVKGVAKQNDITFTNREFEILKLVAEGLTSKEIAEKLFLSNRTVEGHKANMIAKTGSKNIIDLIIYAIKNKFVNL